MLKTKMPVRAFILAAGFGTRMRPYTDTIPKPMVEVAGRSLIYRILDRLARDHVTEVVVNMHYKAKELQAHLDAYLANETGGQGMTIHTSHEEDILDTGGGVKLALNFFKDEPFYVIAGDAYWTDEEGTSAFQELAAMWDAQKMDIATLFQPVDKMELTKGVGDFDLNSDGSVRRSKDKSGAYMWTNIRLNSPGIFKDAPEGAFSFLSLMDKAEQDGRFFAKEHKGAWHHISTPEDLDRVNAVEGTAVLPQHEQKKA